MKRAKSTKRISDRRAGFSEEYSLFKAKYMLDHFMCEACKTVRPTERRNRALDIHHLKGRPHCSTGKYGTPNELIDPENVIAVCRVCHDWIGANRRLAIARGLLRTGAAA